MSGVFTESPEAPENACRKLTRVDARARPVELSLGSCPFC